MKMTEIQIVYPPNKPLDRVYMPSKNPVCYDHLYFIDINDEGEVILGCSNVVGGYWESTLFFYRNGDDALINKYSNYYIGGTSTSDAVFIPNSRKIVLAEDTSHLRLLSITEEPSLKCIDFYNSNERIEQVTTWDNDKVISCGGNNVCIWDLQNENVTSPVQEYKNIHVDTIKSVAVKPNDNCLFVTASLDRKACIWDIRMQPPATVLYQNEFCGLTSIAWHPKHFETVVIGSSAGDIYNVDIRYIKEFKSNYHCFDTSIHRIKFNNSGYLAVCGDTSKVLVLDPEDNYQTILKQADQDGGDSFVRGLAWHKDTLYTCGFDKKVNRFIFNQIY